MSLGAVERVSPRKRKISNESFDGRPRDEAARSGGIAPTNSTFLAALKATGLSDMLAHGGPYLVFAPTDEAFAALGKDKLDALMSDRQALTNLLRRHIVQG